jgi:hypothetical protein
VEEHIANPPGHLRRKIHPEAKYDCGGLQPQGGGRRHGAVNAKLSQNVICQGPLVPAQIAGYCHSLGGIAIVSARARLKPLGRGFCDPGV